MASPVVEVEPDAYRPWFQKWLNVTRALTALEDAYRRPPTGGNLEVDARVERFFNECNDMRDWLKADHSNLPQLVGQDVDGHAHRDPHLRICAGIANTHKHHTVTRGPDPMNARIRRTRTSDAGAGATIEYSSLADSTPRHVDALSLARSCVASWRRFFGQHGIAEP